MTVRYHSRGGAEVPDYECVRECIDNAGSRCQTIPGGAADTAIGKLLLDTLTSLTLEVALTVQAEIEARAADSFGGTSMTCSPPAAAGWRCADQCPGIPRSPTASPATALLR
jgi:hypothetical protein